MSQELIFKPGKAKSTLCDEDILLLDQHDRIIGIYPAEGAETELRIGDSLIDAFGIDTFDQGALERARQGAVGLLLMVSAGKIVFREKPEVVVTTGALIAFPFCLYGKLVGAKVIYIESFARVHDRSLTGRLVYPMADLVLVQWESLLEVYPKAKYVGGIF